MSTRVSAFLRVVLYEHDVQLSPPARHLAEVLGHYADSTATAWPSIITLCRRTGYCDKTIRRARAELVAAGVIAFEQRRGNPADPQSRNRYRFPLGMPLALSTDLPRGGRSDADTPPTTFRGDLPPRSGETSHVVGGTRSIEGAKEGAAAHVDDDAPVVVPAWVYERFAHLMGPNVVARAL